MLTTIQAFGLACLYVRNILSYRFIVEILKMYFLVTVVLVVKIHATCQLSPQHLQSHCRIIKHSQGA